ncbi:Uncharacterized protein pbN1_25100 [Aromatoleum bremense]|nr:Uncharacterized protein pbN1_25100 [Aromatoleum bremense]
MSSAANDTPASLIPSADPVHPRSGYVPFWA